jgi:hypothetical protein
MQFFFLNRELPGFGSTRLLLATVSQELDQWRSLVEEIVLQSFDLYENVSEGLAEKLTSSFPKLTGEIKKSVNVNMSKQMEVINRRVDEMFDHSVEGASSDHELIDTINSIRFARFDQTLREALMVITNNIKFIREMGIPMTANILHRATNNTITAPPPPPSPQGQQQAPQQQQGPQQQGQQQGQQVSPMNQNNNNPNNRQSVRANSQAPPPQQQGQQQGQPQQGQQQQPQQQQQQGQPGQQQGQGPPGGSPHPPLPQHHHDEPQISKEELKSYITDILGNAYMSIHALDYGTLLHLDEAVAVLQSYWRINEKRINEEIQSILDLILLQQCSENIEKDLLLNVQLLLSDNEKLEELFLEDPAITQKRNELTALKVKIEKLLVDVDKLAPLKADF